MSQHQIKPKKATIPKSKTARRRAVDSLENDGGESMISKAIFTFPDCGQFVSSAQ
jgi:hypothetical protein